MMGGQSEHPELWAFLEAVQPGEILSGAVAAIESFGVFVALDDGPRHPSFPGVGFITLPELSWQSFGAASDVVRVGEHVACKFLRFDTHNLEARLSLRATQPDPFQSFVHQAAPGQRLTGRITKLVPFGAFVRVAEGIKGLVRDLHDGRVGDELAVIIADIDRQRRRIELRVSPPS
ncbi:ribosomal protein S1 [Catenulispora sp. MAP5-51]|uniref:S1 RNA-binding domain-containing protein n=1 Tax=Catenulispora sp. MAP5-51 TaxID=3156298 RepID=UPI0035126245